MNGKAKANEMDPKSTGIGITNVMQRLNLLYHDKHELQIREEEEDFIVSLKLVLQKIEASENVNHQSTVENYA